MNSGTSLSDAGPEVLRPSVADNVTDNGAFPSTSQAIPEANHRQRQISIHLPSDLGCKRVVIGGFSGKVDAKAPLSVVLGARIADNGRFPSSFPESWMERGRCRSFGQKRLQSPCASIRGVSEG
ncbi:hypothetical protein [Adlercreutzia sp. ZJ242]|uniref:hypothetical protein n=1 Tax=Adlercreutzia sp. ZJ242 TaxID=2709409 RepID=UPI00197FB916|nr:hypothetical protein [Adlercreutzia sp. ZJ242]